MIDKQTKRIVKSTRDLVCKSLASLGVKMLAVIAGTSYPFWDVLLPMIKIQSIFVGCEVFSGLVRINNKAGIDKCYKLGIVGRLSLRNQILCSWL